SKASAHAARSVAERAARAELARAQRDAAAAAENTPQRIAQRRHDAQIAALEAADAAERAKLQQERADANCRIDAACWFQRHDFDAYPACTRAVEATAKFQHEWTDSIFGKRRFDR